MRAAPGPRATAALALAAALAAGAPAAAPASPASELRAIAEAYVEGRIERHPETATAMGLRRHDGRLAPGSPAARAEERRWLEALGTRLERVPRAALPPRSRLERDLLASRLDAARFALDDDRAWERDPGAALRAIAGALEGAASPGRGACARLQAVARRMAAAPERLRTAMVDLAAPEREATAAAIEAARTLEARHRAGFGLGPRDCRESRLQADFAVADSASLRALEAYRRHLEESVLPVARPRGPRGRERIAAWLAATERETLAIGALIERTQADIAALAAGPGAPGAAAGAALPSAGRADRRSPLGRLVAAEALPDEGARLAWERAIADLAPGAGSPPDPDAGARALARARRLWAVLARHAGGYDAAAAAAWLVERGGASPEEAAREADAAWADPAEARPGLLDHALREARDAAAGAGFGPAAFAHAARAAGPLPSGLLREAILAELGVPDRAEAGIR